MKPTAGDHTISHPLTRSKTENQMTTTPAFRHRPHARGGGEVEIKIQCDARFFFHTQHHTSAWFLPFLPRYVRSLYQTIDSPVCADFLPLQNFRREFFCCRGQTQKLETRIRTSDPPWPGTLMKKKPHPKTNLSRQYTYNMAHACPDRSPCALRWTTCRRPRRPPPRGPSL